MASSLGHPSNIERTQPTSAATPVTPPYRSEPGQYHCVVEYHRKPYHLAWSGTGQYPDLEAFPKDLDAYPLHQHEELAMIWRSSTLLDYGSHAVVRCYDCEPGQEHDECFPAVKLAHADAESMALIQNEIKILSELKSSGLPVPVIDERIIDVDGIPLGFRMKRLFKMDMADIPQRTEEIRRALQQLHDTGFCHGDLSPSNIMTDEQDRVVLIDFSHAGRIDGMVPDIVQRQGYCDDRYKTDHDWQTFHRFFAPPL